MPISPRSYKEELDAVEFEWGLSVLIQRIFWKSWKKSKLCGAAASSIL